ACTRCSCVSTTGWRARSPPPNLGVRTWPTRPSTSRSTRRPAPSSAPRSRSSPTTGGFPRCWGPTPCRSTPATTLTPPPTRASPLSGAAQSRRGDDIESINTAGPAFRAGIPLNVGFFTPPQITQANTGIGHILKYLASDPSSEVDTSITDPVRNFLFGQPGQGGFDLSSLNMQRGRDHGLADYNTLRAALGLAPLPPSNATTPPTTHPPHLLL